MTGANSFLLQQRLRTLVDDFVAANGDMSLEQLDGEEAEYNRIREALQSLPFLASKKLVVLQTPSANKQFIEHAELLLSGLPDSSDVIIVEPKLDKRTSYYKYLLNNGELQEFTELDESALGKWIVERVVEGGGTISAANARYLIERVSLNQRLISNEIAKLLNYNEQITKDTIDLLVELTPQSSIFDLIDAAFAGRIDRAMNLYDEQRKSNIEPQQIMAMIAWQLHVLALIKLAGDRDPSTIAREAKLNPYVVRKSISVARTITLSELKVLVREVVELDSQLKSQSIDADEALRNLIIRLSTI